eukprot:gene27180-biopygen17724
MVEDLACTYLQALAHSIESPTWTSGGGSDHEPD